MSAPAVRRPVAAPSLFVGRDRELARLRVMLGRVRVAIVCGVAGIGKSTLACAFAVQRGGPAVRRRAEIEPLSVLLDDVRRSLAAGPVPELTSDGDRITDLAARLDAAGATWLLDDLHRLPGKARTTLLAGLGDHLRTGTVIATSRERMLDGGSDHAELVLEGLEQEDAAALWNLLDELHGPAAGADVALRRAKGSPFQLRRAHAGGLHDDDPIASTVASLGPDELRLARALALTTPRLPSALVCELLPRERATAALRRLATLLVVEVDGASRCGLHQLFQEALLAVGGDDRGELHARLADLLQRDPELDPVLVAREVTRHLAAAGRHDDAARYLVTHGADLVRRGATAELLGHLEALPPGARSPATALVRARCIARLLDLPRAHAEVAKLLEAGVEPRAGIVMAHAELGFSLGDLAGGIAAVRGIADDPESSPEIRANVLDQLCLMRTQRGEGELARRALREAEIAESDAVRAAAHAFTRAFSAWVDEDDEALGLALHQAQGMLPDAGQPYAARVLVPAAMAGMLARLGRHDEASTWLASAEAHDRHEDPYSQVYMHRMRGAVLYERGDRLGALAELTHASRAYAAAGALVPAWSADVFLARVHFLLGRRRQALLLCERVREQAEPAGALALVRAAERSMALDPLTMLAGSDPNGPVSDAVAIRVRAVSALQVAASGDADKARRLLDALATELGALAPPSKPDAAEAAGREPARGFALDHAIASLGEATLARLEGRATAAQDELARAVLLADEGGADPELVAELDRRLGRVRLITAERRRTVASAELGAYSVILDGARHELRRHGKVISFGHRPALRRLLYALASQPNVAISKEALARAVWGARYRPSTHDGALWVNVRRLRVLLEPTGVAVELREDGYRLRVPGDFVFVDTPHRPG